MDSFELEKFEHYFKNKPNILIIIFFKLTSHALHTSHLVQSIKLYMMGYPIFLIETN